MAGQVQMIYIDPPYGIKVRLQLPALHQQARREGPQDEDLTQEPEMIKAFRDTWELGIHSYPDLSARPTAAGEGVAA